MLVLFDGEIGPRETLRFIEEKLAAGIWRWNLTTGQHEWSDGMYALYGLKRGVDNPDYETVVAMTHPDDRRPPGTFELAIRSGLPLDREFRIIWRNGRVRWLYNRGEVLMDSNGRPAKAIGVVIDTTAHHEEMQILRMGDQRRRALMQAAGTVVWTEPADAVIDVKSWSELRAADRSGLPGFQDLEQIHPDDRERTIAAWNSAVRGKSLYQIEHRVREPDGTYRVYQSRAAPVLNADGSVYEWVGMSYDIHAQKEWSAGVADPMKLTGAQIRGARGILNWSVRDLADAAQTSPAVIRRLEESNGTSTLPDDPLPQIKHAFEHAGVEFLDPPDGKPGIRLR